MAKVKDAFVTDQDPPDDFRVDPEYDEKPIAVPSGGLRGISAWTATNFENRGKLFLALSKAQGELSNVEAKHEGYKGRYKFAKLDQVLDLIRPIFSSHGLAFVQLVGDAPDGRVMVTTVLGHESGQTIQTTSSMAIHPQPGLSPGQCAGVVITYLRRYQLTALAGIAQEDTDAAPAKHDDFKKGYQRQLETFQKPVPNPDVIRALTACEDLETLAEMWGKLSKADHKLYEGVKNIRKKELQELASVDDDIPQ